MSDRDEEMILDALNPGRLQGEHSRPNDSEVKQIVDHVNMREEKRYAFIRHILVLAAGILSILIALRSNGGQAGIPHFCVSLSLVLLGVGILTGAIALHGEVWLHSNRARLLIARKEKKLLHHDVSSGPIVSSLIWPYKASRAVCYFSLATAIILLITYSVLFFN
jgi:hypothetical protein